MGILQLLLPLFFCSIVLVPSKAADHDCPVSKCSPDGPLIKFPFRLKHQPLHCGNPEFEVSCSSFSNMTMIQLSSSSGLFTIQTIDYENQYFDVYNRDGCLPRRLVNFTISSSSLFQPARLFGNDYCIFSGKYFPDLKLLNCSTPENFSTGNFNKKYIPITCLSIPGHQVVATLPSTSLSDLPVPRCRSLIGPIYLPLRRVGGNPDNCVPDSVLILKWDLGDFPGCQNCKAGRCQFNYNSNQLECHPELSPPPPPPSPPPPSPGVSNSKRPRYIIGVSIACFVLISVASVAIFFHVTQTKRIEEKENQMKIERFLNDHKSHVPTRYSCASIKKMTDGFKKKLGEGGFGSVFLGKLPNGVQVAVKVLNGSKRSGEDFINEVGTIGRIHHVNVVRLLGFSAEGCKRALIYEFMPNKSLEKFITSRESNNNDTTFDWKKLQHIITGIGKGIEYLHQGCDQRILHFDIKPQNILLDHDFNPKISDFGLAKLCSKEESIISMTAARGTVGYIAPEVFIRNFTNVSYKSDVYSFGMLVLEMIGARREPPLGTINSEVYFPEWIYKRLIQGGTLDLKLDTDEDAHVAKKLVIVAIWCIQWHPVNRPSMKSVVRMLEGDSESLIVPPNPFTFTSTQTS
ncbi:rust resistance kinase Lr10 isoform X1 [Rosa chinensis]|uniref:rust resistance kinase Lr10 isoform X1 n=1 Tax=Rosa chinensis TaxID=74649 RepID=UPI000D091380|nr:rust resistance kinase Lr10 isoform X1 [Rosa chinensis]